MTYRYASNSSRNKYASNVDLPAEGSSEYGEIPKPLDPFEKSGQVKPYIPATNVDAGNAKPLGANLDSPLN